MKNLFVLSCTLLIGISVFSCKDDDYETIDSTEKIKIDSVLVPYDTMYVNKVQNIKTFSTYATTCNGFFGYDYIHTGSFSRDVTAYQYTSNGNCTIYNHQNASILKFSPNQTGTYTLRFWKGDNNWITKTIVVQ